MCTAVVDRGAKIISLVPVYCEMSLHYFLGEQKFRQAAGATRHQEIKYDANATRLKCQKYSGKYIVLDKINNAV